MLKEARAWWTVLFKGVPAVGKKLTPHDGPDTYYDQMSREAHHALIKSLDDDLADIGWGIPWRQSHRIEPLVLAQWIRLQRATLQKSE